MIPGSPEWNRLITASKVAAILGVSPWDSPRSLWHEMRGDVERAPQNSAMSRGHYLEPAILAWWRDQHGVTDKSHVWFDQPEFVMGDLTDDTPIWAAATPDASTTLDGDEVLVEAKSASNMDEWGEPGTDQIPAYYLSQVYWQLHVSKAARCYVPVIGPFLTFSEYVVERDDEVGALLEAKCRAFYDSLQGDEPPELDDSTATFTVLRRLHKDIEAKAVATLDLDDAHEFVDASLALSAAEARDRKARARVLEVMGTAQYADANGVRVARRQANKSGVSLVRVAKATAGLTTEPEGEVA